jgi:hypothetical protein
MKVLFFHDSHITQRGIKMNDDVKGNSNVEQTVVKPVFSNMFRVAYSETEFFVDYGFTVPEEKDREDLMVNLVSKIVIPADRFSTLILSLFRAATEYEKQFNKDIGFGTNKDKSEDGE